MPACRPVHSNHVNAFNNNWSLPSTYTTTQTAPYWFVLCKARALLEASADPSSLPLLAHRYEAGAAPHQVAAVLPRVEVPKAAAAEAMQKAAAVLRCALGVGPWSEEEAAAGAAAGQGLNNDLWGELMAFLAP